jgi:hypothetical protein
MIGLRLVGLRLVGLRLVGSRWSAAPWVSVPIVLAAYAGWAVAMYFCNRPVHRALSTEVACRRETITESGLLKGMQKSQWKAFSNAHVAHQNPNAPISQRWHSSEDDKDGCVFVEPGTAKTDLGGWRTEGDLFVSALSKAGTIASDHCFDPARGRPYPLDCSSHQSAATLPDRGSSHGHLILDNVKARTVVVRGYFSGLSAVHLTAEALDLSEAQFSGCVSLRYLRVKTLQADWVAFLGGLDAFRARVDGDAEFTASRFVGSASLQDSEITGTLMLNGSHFDGKRLPFVNAICPQTEEGAWNLVGIHVGWLLGGLVSIGGAEPLNLERAELDSLDVRNRIAAASCVPSTKVAFARWNVRNARIAKSLSFTSEAATGASVFSRADGLRLGSALNVVDGLYCGSATRIGSAPDLARVLRPAGFDDEQPYADIAKSQGAVRDMFYFERRKSTGYAVVEMALAGLGRWSFASYALLFAILYVLTIRFFWERPPRWSMSSILVEGQASEQHDVHWKTYRFVYALAVLLPGIVNLGVEIKPRDGYYWEVSDNAGEKLTVTFHWLRLVGGLFAALALYAVGLRLK